MPTISLTLPTAGTVITAGLHSANYSALQTLLNGTVDTSNLAAAAAIKGSQLAAGITGAPGTELTYDQFTSNVSVTATTEATANTVVTAAPFTFDGVTPVIIEFDSMQVATPATLASFIVFVLYDGANSIGFLGLVQTPAAAITAVPVHRRRRLTPSNASHTYSIRAYVSAGTGTVSAGAGGAAANMPGYIRITKA